MGERESNTRMSGLPKNIGLFQKSPTKIGNIQKGPMFMRLFGVLESEKLITRLFKLSDLFQKSSTNRAGGETGNTLVA